MAGCHGGIKMNRLEVGKEASQQTGSELYFQTYQGLLRQRDRIDREILKLQGKFLKALSRSKGILPSRKKKYVPRLKNTITLAQAIRKAMTPGQKMTMDDVLKSLSSKKLYNTNSDQLYTMVNNKLNSDKLIKKVEGSRGVFVYKPHSKKKNKQSVDA